MLRVKVTIGQTRRNCSFMKKLLRATLDPKTPKKIYFLRMDIALKVTLL